jgi:DNA mismatch endonuclease (patch repair protein)
LRHRKAELSNGGKFVIDALARNKQRDHSSIAKLRRRGWRALVIWECKTKDIERVAAKLRRFLAD